MDFTLLVRSGMKKMTVTFKVTVNSKSFGL